MSFTFKLADDFRSVLIIPAFQSLRGALQPGPHSYWVEDFDGFVAKRLLEGFSEFFGGGVAMPGLFGHRLVDRLAHRLVDSRVELGGGHRNEMQDRIGHGILSGAFKWPAAGQHFVTNDTQGENAGNRGNRLHFDLLGRHIEKRSLASRRAAGFNTMSDSEIDDLDRVILQHEDVARLDVAMDEPLLMSRLQSAAGLASEIDRP